MHELISQINNNVRLLFNRLRNVLTEGVLTVWTPANNKTPTALIQATLFSDETLNTVPFPQEYGFLSAPPADGSTQLLIAFKGGQRDQGIVLKAWNPANTLNLPLQPGEAAIFNGKTGSYILMKADGSIKIHSSVAVNFDTPSVTMNGSLTVDGDIIDNATGPHSNSNNIREMRTIYNEHIHGGVFPGSGDTATTTETQ